MGKNFVCGLDLNSSAFCCGCADSEPSQSHVCAGCLSNVCIKCRGGEAGQLGIAIDAPSSDNTLDYSIEYWDEVAVAGEHRFIQIVAGYLHACGLDDEYAAWCWG